MSKLELELDLTPYFAKELELSKAPKKSERDPPLEAIVCMYVVVISTIY